MLQPHFETSGGRAIHPYFWVFDLKYMWYGFGRSWEHKRRDRFIHCSYRYTSGNGLYTYQSSPPGDRDGVINNIS